MHYKEMGISNDILKALNKLNYEQPTDVQQLVIPKVLDGKDIIVKSQTGSGKTGAFTIPVLEMIEWEENKAQALILVPTRELALQVEKYVHNMGRFKRIKTVSVFGKSSFESQMKNLKQKTHVIIGTPGRLLDHIDRETIDLSSIKYLVLDEADEMLNMGFISQIEDVIDVLPSDRQSILLSATMPEQIASLSRKYLKNPELIEIENKNTVNTRITQEKFLVASKDDKLTLLDDLCVVHHPESCIVFCNTRQMVDDVKDYLVRKDYPVKKLHGGMDQADRTRVMDDFKKGTFRYLVATDVAARGIDVENIELVVNFDLPFENENYVHRIGRTGRNGLLGHAVSFYFNRESRVVGEIEELIGMELVAGVEPSTESILENKAIFRRLNATKRVVKNKSQAIDEGIIRIHINAGKKQKMRPTDIVGTLCNIDGITKEDIGIINIQDISTYFEVLHGKGKIVLKALKHKPLKGRIRRVSIADEQ